MSIEFGKENEFSKERCNLIFVQVMGQRVNKIIKR